MESGGTAGGAGGGGASAPVLRVACVCASNMNRSMRAHGRLAEDFAAGTALGARLRLDLHSYGTGRHVKLPGPSAAEPNVYAFGTAYAAMRDELAARDRELYVRNGVLAMLERNARVKRAPERWQDRPLAEKYFDVVLTFDARVLEAILDDIEASKTSDLVGESAGGCLRVCHVVNLNIKDNHEDSAAGAALASQFMAMLADRPADWPDAIDTIIQQFYRATGRTLFHTPATYCI